MLNAFPYIFLIHLYIYLTYTDDIKSNLKCLNYKLIDKCNITL